MESEIVTMQSVKDKIDAFISRTMDSQEVIDLMSIEFLDELDAKAAYQKYGNWEGRVSKDLTPYITAAVIFPRGICSMVRHPETREPAPKFPWWQKGRYEEAFELPLDFGWVYDKEIIKGRLIQYITAEES